MPSHRWGKINHGQTYGLLADDVARRLATLRLGDYERLLLNHIREHSWARSTRRKGKGGTWPDAMPFTDTIDAVARQVASGRLDEPEIRSLRKRLYEAAKTLKESRILVEADGPIDGLLINTDCDDWKVYGREILPSYVCLSYATGAQNGAAEGEGSGPEDPSEDMIATDDHVRQSGHAYPPERACVSANPGTHARQNGHGHIEERAQKDLIQTSEDKEEKTPHPPAVRGVSEDGGSSAPPKPSGSEVEALGEAVHAAALRQRARAGYPKDLGSAEDAQRHATMLARGGSYAVPDILSAYLSAIESNPKPGKWGQAVSTNLHNRRARLAGEALRINAESAGRAARASPRAVPAQSTLPPSRREMLRTSKPERNEAV